MHKQTFYGHASLPSGIKVFYREGGHADKPVVLLLHGFPSSSNQYRNLIPLLSQKYHVFAPDLPGFGFTEVPDSLKYQYTFANLATTILEFLDQMKISNFAVYIFDYGAPTALRIALQRPKAITAIVTQNGNAYEVGLGKDFWAPLQAYWKTEKDSKEYHGYREAIQSGALTHAEVKREYFDGEADPERTVDPATYHHDWTLMQRPGNFDIQLDLFYDYQTNVELYPKFHEYLRESQVPVLAIWGKNDIIFVKEGAQAFEQEKHTKNCEVKLIDGGHFAVESHTEEIADDMLRFFEKHGI